MKCHRASVLDSKGHSPSINIPKVKESRDDSGVSVVSKNPVSTEEQVWTFLWATSDHQAYQVESKEHAYIAFELII